MEGLGKCDCGCGRKHGYAHHRIFEGTVMWFAEVRCIASYQQNGYVEVTDLKPINGAGVFHADTPYTAQTRH
jgi:hypothetical protein